MQTQTTWDTMARAALDAIANRIAAASDDELRDQFAGTPAAAAFEPGNERAAGSLRALLLDRLKHA